jgi:hemerythrin-like domain-containing protein
MMRHEQSPTANLRAEHRVILRVVAAFERMLERHGTDALPLEHVEECITFFRLFADACHHGKEEDLLFGALEEHGLGGGAGPIAMMREEHAAGRAFVSGMVAALDALRGGEEAAESRLRFAADAYITLIRGHIGREDDGLFEIADQAVSGEACNRLCAAYEAVCSRRFEGRSLASLEQSAERLSELYPA